MHATHIHTYGVHDGGRITQIDRQTYRKPPTHLRVGCSTGAAPSGRGVAQTPAGCFLRGRGAGRTTRPKENKKRRRYYYLPRQQTRSLAHSLACPARTTRETEGQTIDEKNKVSLLTHSLTHYARMTYTADS